MLFVNGFFKLFSIFFATLLLRQIFALLDKYDGVCYNGT